MPYAFKVHLISSHKRYVLPGSHDLRTSLHKLPLVKILVCSEARLFYVYLTTWTYLASHNCVLYRLYHRGNIRLPISSEFSLVHNGVQQPSEIHDCILTIDPRGILPSC